MPFLRRTTRCRPGNSGMLWSSRTEPSMKVDRNTFCSLRLFNNSGGGISLSVKCFVRNSRSDPDSRRTKSIPSNPSKCSNITTPSFLIAFFIYAFPQAITRRSLTPCTNSIESNSGVIAYVSIRNQCRPGGVYAVLNLIMSNRKCDRTVGVGHVSSSCRFRGLSCSQGSSKIRAENRLKTERRRAMRQQLVRVVFRKGR